MNRLTDEQLMARVVAGEPAAFEALYDRHAGRAMWVARRICRDPEMAAEAVQDAFLSIWRGRARYDEAHGAFAGWAMTVVRNRAIDLIRKESAGVQRAALDDELLATLSDTGPGPSQLVAQRAAADRVRRQLDALPHAQRQAVVLSFYGGLSHGQIAERLQVPVGTVKGRMRLALAKLRSSLEPEAELAAAS